VCVQGFLPGLKGGSEASMNALLAPRAAESQCGECSKSWLTVGCMQADAMLCFMVSSPGEHLPRPLSVRGEGRLIQNNCTRSFKGPPSCSVTCVQDGSFYLG
jgi:hypothetical protein